MVLLALGPWSSPTSASDPRPVQGRFVPELASLDALVHSYLDAAGFPGLSLAVSRNGHLVYARAFGWTDSTRTIPLAFDSPLPVASLSKVLTDTAITRLITQGRLSGTNRIVELLGLQPPRGMTFAPEAQDITVDHLLIHSAGLPQYRADNQVIGDLLQLGRLASLAEILSWHLTQPLLFTPGTGTQYSNTGYALLGVVIEHVTGLSYGEYLTRNFGLPLEMATLGVAQELQVTNPSPATPLLAETYGGIASAGGIRVSASDLCRFMRAYRLNGILKPRPIPSGTFLFSFFGSLPESLSVANQRILGGTSTEFAVICNGRGYRDNAYLRDLFRDHLIGISQWPTNNLFPWFTWRMDRFWNPATGLMVPGSRAEDDPDADQLQNLLEFVHDRDPLRPEPQPVPKPIGFASGPTRNFLFRRSPAHADIHLQVDLSPDLVRWTPIALSTFGLPVQTGDPERFTILESPDSTHQNVRVTWSESSSPTSPPAEFIRLRYFTGPGPAP